MEVWAFMVWCIVVIMPTWVLLYTGFSILVTITHALGPLLTRLRITMAIFVIVVLPRHWIASFSS